MSNDKHNAAMQNLLLVFCSDQAIHGICTSESARLLEEHLARLNCSFQIEQSWKQQQRNATRDASPLQEVAWHGESGTES